MVEQIGDLIRNNMTDGPLKDMLVDGIVGGVGGVIVFLPSKRALHDISGLINIVMRRLFRFSIVREAIIAGTLHPNPIIKGINDFPCNPILCIILSIIPLCVRVLPPYRMPTAKSIFRHTWEKGAQYLKKMGGIIMVASVIIWFLGYYPNHDAYETVAEQQENSYIGQLGRAIEPVIEPMGFDWKLGIGLISGVGAKELVVSTLGVLYVDDPDADSVSLAERIPITPLVAFCYMLFVLIYFPCIAALAAIKQESGSWKWALFAACYTTVLAWLVSFAVYQIGGLFV